MGIVLPVDAEKLQALLAALEGRGWSRPPKAEWHYREKLVDGRWAWFGRLRGEVYVLSSDVLPEAEGEDFLRDYRQGVRGLQEEAEGLHRELDIPGLAKVDLEFSGG